MAIAHDVWGEVVRPWGYELRIDLRPDSTPEVFHEVAVFPSAPTAAERAAHIAHLKVALAAWLLNRRAARIAELRARMADLLDRWQEYKQELDREEATP